MPKVQKKYNHSFSVDFGHLKSMCRRKAAGTSSARRSSLEWTKQYLVSWGHYGRRVSSLSSRRAIPLVGRIIIPFRHIFIIRNQCGSRKAAGASSARRSSLEQTKESFATFPCHHCPKCKLAHEHENANLSPETRFVWHINYRVFLFFFYDCRSKSTTST